MNVWLDREDIPGGAAWESAIGEAFSASSAVPWCSHRAQQPTASAIAANPVQMTSARDDSALAKSRCFLRFLLTMDAPRK